MQIVINVKDGSNAEAMARALRFQANLLDGIDAKKAASNAMTGSPLKKKAKADDDEEIEETDDEEIEETEDDEDTEESDDADVEESDDDDDSDDAEDDDAEETEDDEEEPPPKKAKGKKGKPKGPTLKDVNAALKARAEKTSFKKAKLWLKAKFKVESINDVKPTDYAKLIKLAKAA